MNDDSSLQVPAQSIPIPRSLSRQARAYMVRATQTLYERGVVGKTNAASSEQSAQAAAALEFLRPVAMSFRGREECIELAGGARLYCMIPESCDGRFAEVAFFDIHGGGFCSGGGELCQVLARVRAAEYGAAVFAIDYRLLPDFAYPCALDDCIAGYREILSRYAPQNLVVGGFSAGANLAAAMLLRGRDEGLSLPAALVLQTPVLDMLRSGDSYRTNRFVDVNLYGGTDDLSDQYVGEADPAHPYISPLYGDFSKGWPPTILTSGSRDLLLSDTLRMHRYLRRAGVAAELHVMEAGSHGGFLGIAPEDMEIADECRRFTYAAWCVGDWCVGD